MGCYGHDKRPSGSISTGVLISLVTISFSRTILLHYSLPMNLQNCFGAVLFNLNFLITALKSNVHKDTVNC
jgi:hypothetical protein